MRRPKTVIRRDPDRTRRAIVAAALDEYSLYGPAGARVDRIAAAAGVNKRMIYHYFGSKAGLWAGLLDDQWGAEPVLSNDAAGSIADQLTSGALRIAGRPAVTRLLAWEALTTAASEIDMKSTRAAAWRDRITRLVDAQRDGRLSQQVDAAQLELALTALLVFPYVFPQITRMITGYTVADAAFVDARVALFRSLSELLSAPRPAAPAATQAKPRFRLAAAVTEVER